MKTTQWYGRDTVPGLIGVYQTADLDPTRAYFHLDQQQGYQYWDGRTWGCFCKTPQEAYNRRYQYSYFQDNWWRGLAKETK